MTKESSNNPNPAAKPNTDKALAKLQNKLGYQFTDMGLLERAVTHKSFAKQNNERLEFLGDAVLGYLVGDMVYLHYTHLREDALSLMRSQLVRRETLAEVARDIGMVQCLRIGSGEKRSGGRQRDSLLLGAMHLDGGITACADCVTRLFHTPMLALADQDLRDPKTRLQEWLQARKLGLPEYLVDEVLGADHMRQYRVVCKVAEIERQAAGHGSSRRNAEKEAARNLLSELERADNASQTDAAS